MFKKKAASRWGRRRPGRVRSAEVIDRSTYEDPTRLSEGFVHVLVNGVPVVLNGKLRTEVDAGPAGAGPGARVIRFQIQ